MKNFITIQFKILGDQIAQTAFLKKIESVGGLLRKSIDDSNCGITFNFNYDSDGISEALDHAFNEIWDIKEKFLGYLNEHNLKLDVYIVSNDYDGSTLLYLTKDILRKINFFSVNLFFDFNKPSPEGCSFIEDKTQITIDLGINSKEDRFSPDDCTRQTGIIPDEVIHKGETNSAGRKIPFSEWRIENKRNSQNFDIAIDETINRIEQNLEKLVVYATANKFDIMLNAYITLENDAPDFFMLSAKNIKRIIALNCDVGFDLYDYQDYNLK